MRKGPSLPKGAVRLPSFTPAFTPSPAPAAAAPAPPPNEPAPEPVSKPLGLPSLPSVDLSQLPSLPSLPSVSIPQFRWVPGWNGKRDCVAQTTKKGEWQQLLTSSALCRSVPSFDASKVELPKVNLPSFEVPKLDLPSFDAPKADLPSFDLSKVELPQFEAPKLELPQFRCEGSDDAATRIQRRSSAAWRSVQGMGQRAVLLQAGRWLPFPAALTLIQLSPLLPQCTQG